MDAIVIIYLLMLTGELLWLNRMKQSNRRKLTRMTGGLKTYVSGGDPENRTERFGQ